jgi:hypothetical protein
MLVQELRDGCIAHAQSAAGLPERASYRFDRNPAGSETPERPLFVLKTSHREIVSLRFARFESQEVVRQDRAPEGPVTRHSPELAAVVPRGARYAYDLMAYVGVESLLRGRPLQELAQDLAALQIPFSSLYDLQRKFMFYFGQLHRQAARRIRDYLRQRGGVTWQIDGTQELGSPVFFGVKEATDGFLLGCWKIGSENLDDVAPCLVELQEAYGLPDRAMHDLSDTMIGACDRALPGVPHHVCQFHLLKDIGKDLFEAPQAALSELVRQLKLQPRMKEQRGGQIQWLRENDVGPGDLVLRDLLEGKPAPSPWPELLGRELLLAFHQWILDFARDGRRQGFPFDPNLLYLHRRVVQARAGLNRLCEPQAGRKMPLALSNLKRMLNDYLDNPRVVAALVQYEAAWTVFQSLRDVLRFSAQGTSPLRDSYRLTATEQGMMFSSLQELRDECRRRSTEDADLQQRQLCGIVSTHLERYWDYLPKGTEHYDERTNNGIETLWRHGKRTRRRVHGRSKLTQDFQALPPEYMLIQNLENPRYVELVLGTLDNLAEKLADAGRTAGPFSAWQRNARQNSLGRLPKRLLRKENALAELVEYYDDWQEQVPAKAAG